MKRNTWGLLFLICFILMGRTSFAAEDPLVKFHKKGIIPATARAPAEKTSKLSPTLEEVSKKIDRLLSGQEKILQDLDEIKKELYIVKIRATKR